MRVLSHTVIVASVLIACLAAFPQITRFEVQLGGTVILPCNISDTSRGELDVRWEAMGKTVAFFQEGQLMAGQGYEGRIQLQISKALQGDFSLTLKSVMMSDTDLYECLWQGRRSQSTATLTILPPPYPEANTTLEGREVVLPCFGRIPKHKPWEKMYIQWFKDDKEILLLDSGEMSKKNRDLTLLPKESIRHGILSLIIRSVRASDQGVYKCFYKANDYEAPRSGVPEMFSLSVLASVTTSEMPHTAQVTNDVTQARTGGLLFEIINGTSEDSTTVQDTNTVTSEQLVPTGTSSEFIGLNPDGTTVQDIVGGTSDSLTQPSMNLNHIGLIADVSPESPTIEGVKDPHEFLGHEKIPWVRIGIVSGGLLVTTVFLGTLVALGKL